MTMRSLIEYIISYYQELATAAAVIFSFLNIVVAGFILREYRLMRNAQSRPEVVYYITVIDGMYYGIIENIGNGLATDIVMSLRFKQKFLGNTFFKKTETNEGFVFSFHNLVPKQKMQLELGYRSITDRTMGFETHNVNVTYYDSRGGNKAKRDFIINKDNILYQAREITVKGLIESIEKLTK